MTLRQRFALLALTSFLVSPVRSIAQVPDAPPVAGDAIPPGVPIPPADAAPAVDPTARGLIEQALQAAIEGSRLQGQADTVAVVPAPPVVSGPRGLRINVPGVRINVPGVQIGPQPAAVVQTSAPQLRLPELARRSWENSDRLFLAAAPAARADDRLARLLNAAQQYAAALRALGGQPAFNLVEVAHLARLNHAVLGMLDATALERLADAAGPNGPPAAELRQLAAQQAGEALDVARLDPAAPDAPPGVVAQATGVIVVAPNVRPALVLLRGFARDLLMILNDLEPRLPRNAPAPVPPIRDDLEPIR